jgi:hypothetical protein
MSDAAFGISLPMWSEHQHEHIRVSLLAQVSAAICTTAAFFTFNDDLNLRGRPQLHSVISTDMTKICPATEFLRMFASTTMNVQSPVDVECKISKIILK